MTGLVMLSKAVREGPVSRESWRAARRDDGSWRQHVSPSAAAAHDRIGSEYISRTRGELGINAARAGLHTGGALLAGRYVMGTKAVRAMPVPLQLIGAGAIGATVYPSYRDTRLSAERLIDQTRRQRRIRARGMQRAAAKEG